MQYPLRFTSLPLSSLMYGTYLLVSEFAWDWGEPWKFPAVRIGVRYPLDVSPPASYSLHIYILKVVIGVWSRWIQNLPQIADAGLAELLAWCSLLQQAHHQERCIDSNCLYALQ
jgi:hypothetical protein